VIQLHLGVASKSAQWPHSVRSAEPAPTNPDSLTFRRGFRSLDRTPLTDRTGGNHQDSGLIRVQGSTAYLKKALGIRQKQAIQ
jgi:hypothetical protein